MATHRALLSRRNQRGSGLFLAMMMVTLLASMTLFFAERMRSNATRQESDSTLSYTLELAESANDWNVERIFRNFDVQNDANKLGDNAMSPIGDASQSPIAMLSNQLRSSTTEDPKTYDYLGGSTGNFINRWGSLDGWREWGPGDVKLSARMIESNVGFRYTTVELKAQARMLDPLSGRYLYRQVRRFVKYGVIGDSKIYDFAYFANNYGWMYGTPIYIHGNIGSNGNLGFSGGPTINGLMYAAINPAINAAGVINGVPTYQTLTQYRAGPKGIATTDQQVLPANPAYSEDTNNNGALNSGEDTNGNGILDKIDYKLGWKGIYEPVTGQKPLDIPYLGDMAFFKNEANNTVRPERPDIGDAGGTGGVIKQLKAPGLDPTDPNNYNYIVGGPGKDSVYGNDADENGRIATWDATSGTMSVDTHALTTKINPELQERNGNLALIGTPQQPIVVSGPVVVTNDLLITGTVKGQGTIYIGRNMSIPGDIVYSDPPTFRDPNNGNSSTNINNPNIATTNEANKDKDLIGYAAKGSMVLGQYYRTDDSWNTVRNSYFQSGFQDATLQKYQVDPTDAAIGYVTDYSAGAPYFKGDYKADVTTDATAQFPSGTIPAALNNATYYNAGTGKLNMVKYNNAANWDDGAQPTTKLKYYESVFPDDYLKAFSTAGSGTGRTTKFVAPNDSNNSAVQTTNVRPANISGIFYTNHLFGGRMGNTNGTGMKIFGTMVARDEAILFNNYARFVYDPRVSDKEPSSHVEIYIPVGTKFESLSWEEMTPGQ
ncbi:MAG: hypothetical protein M5U26_22790 [Planctomycetota bacterium]|nr:hypothetical protein [Planctomycetota bacterium]